MSKIQDAIRRLQAEKSGAPAMNPANSMVARQIASVREADERLEGDKRNGNKRTIEVHLEELREQGFLAPVDQEKPLADQYRLIKRPLLDNAAERSAHQSRDANLILVTSALPGDGKTFNCINLALSIAVEKDTSVLLVDADVAKPHISQLFGLRSEPGLIDVLTHQELSIGEVILPTDIPGLSILPAGKQHEHATELLASRRMEAAVAALSRESRSRVVIFDSPPLLATSEARVLADHMGQIVLIVCAGKTPQQAVKDSLESLDETKAINLVLNQMTSSGNGNLYGEYGYGYGMMQDD